MFTEFGQKIILSLISIILGGVLTIITTRIKANVSGVKLSEKTRYDYKLFQQEINTYVGAKFDEIKKSLEELYNKNDKEHTELKELSIKNATEIKNLRADRIEQTLEEQFYSKITNICVTNITEIDMLNKQKGYPKDSRVRGVLVTLSSNIISRSKEMFAMESSEITPEVITSLMSHVIQTMQTALLSQFSKSDIEEYLKMGKIQREVLQKQLVEIVEDEANNKKRRLQDAITNYLYGANARFYIFYKNKELYKEIPNA